MCTYLQYVQPSNSNSGFPELHYWPSHRGGGGCNTGNVEAALVSRCTAEGTWAPLTCPSHIPSEASHVVSDWEAPMVITDGYTADYG